MSNLKLVSGATELLPSNLRDEQFIPKSIVIELIQKYQREERKKALLTFRDVLNTPDFKLVDFKTTIDNLIRGNDNA